MRLLKALKRAWLHEDAFGERTVAAWIVWTPILLAAWAVGAVYAAGMVYTWVWQPLSWIIS